MALAIVVKMCCVWVVTAWCCAAVPQGCGVVLGGYREESIAGHVDLPSGLTVDYNTSTLYFSFLNQSSWQKGKVDLGSKSLTVLEDLRGLCWFTTDQVRGTVYAGCGAGGRAGGLYQWNSNASRFHLLGETRQKVLSVHHHSDTLYYCAYTDSEPKLHKFVDGHGSLVSAIPSQVFDVVVDAHGDILFTNGSGVYRWRGDDAPVTRYEGLSAPVYTLAVDRRGAAFACTKHSPPGVWRLHDRELAATQLLGVGCASLAFDAENNMVYAQADRVVRLVPC